jgi:exodeoxyribonuclease V beta subunit
MVEPGESADEATLRAVELPLGGVAGGTQFGTYVHGVLEHTDFAAPDVDEHFRHALREQQFLAPPALQQDAAQEKLVTGLRKVLETPLGALADGKQLADLGAGDRLDEMNFDLPLAGGWSPRGDVSVRAIGEALAPFAHDDAFLAGYLPRLDTPDFAHGVHGYLTGSIDLVCRGLGGDRYLVADYKTNRLGGWDDHLTAWHYRPGALSAAMYAGHYPLQALLYSVALHRYLRWRLPSRGPHSYHPEAHLGGVLYLFVRGMIGADTPIVEGQPCGVFSWRPSPEAIIALCDLLNTGAAPS